MTLSKSKQRMYAKLFLDVFKEEIGNIWDNPELLNSSTITCKVSTRMTRALAKVRVSGRETPWSRDRQLMVAPDTIQLTMSHRVLDMSEERMLAIVKHEVVHLGHWNHGRHFKSMALAVGASINGEAPGLPPIEKKNVYLQVQLGRGTRYKNYAQVENEEEGRELGKIVSNKQIIDGKYITGLRLSWDY